MGSSSPWKVPCGQFVINGINADDLSSLIHQHDLDCAEDGEVLHSEALKKHVMEEYLRMSLLHFGDKHTKEEVHKGKEGKRQLLNKTIIWNGL